MGVPAMEGATETSQPGREKLGVGGVGMGESLSDARENPKPLAPLAPLAHTFFQEIVFWAVVVDAIETEKWSGRGQLRLLQRG